MANSDDFVKAIITFYNAFLESVASAVEDLAGVQEKYKGQYENLREFQKDPAKLYSLLDKMDADRRGLLLDFFLRAQSFEQRLSKLLLLSPEEKRTLSKELRTFLSKYKKLIK